MVQLDAANRLEDFHRLGGHLLTNAVARDDRDSMCHERILAASEALYVAHETRRGTVVAPQTDSIRAPQHSRPTNEVCPQWDSSSANATTCRCAALLAQIRHKRDGVFVAFVNFPPPPWLRRDLAEALRA